MGPIPKSSGRATAGCARCRQAKKGCDQKRPTCGRCLRLNQACGGYSACADDPGWHDVFPARSFSERHQSDPAATPGPQTSQADVDLLQSILDSFKTDFLCQDWSYLAENFLFHPLVKDLMEAYTPVASQDDVSTAAVSHVRAIRAIRMATHDSQAIKEDVTLVASMLLAMFERNNWRALSSSCQWQIHVQGIICLVQQRGLQQIRTGLGRTIFRKAREIIIDAAFCTDVCLPSFVILYSQSMGRYSHDDLDDQLAILEARCAVLWSRHGARDVDGSDYHDVCALRQDLDRWQRQASCGSGEDDQHRDACHSVRLHACCIVVSRVAAGVYEQQSLNSDKCERQKKELSSFTDDLYSCTGNALREVVAARMLAQSGTSAFRLARPLYIIATALADGILRIQSREDQWHRDLLASQASCATDWLQQLAQKFGDRLSLGILQVLELRQSDSHATTASRP